mmetsp:Transcript_39160/g.81918  ORF Transcript_39160/g.81918 Transcript_39160/m.81918 type:complete len:1072 (+) Transcript_39160:146-3361(+)
MNSLHSGLTLPTDIASEDVLNSKIPALVAEGDRRATSRMPIVSSSTSVTSVSENDATIPACNKSSDDDTSLIIDQRNNSGPPTPDANNSATLKLLKDGDDKRVAAIAKSNYVSPPSIIACTPRCEVIDEYKLPSAESSVGHQKSPGPGHRPAIISNPTSVAALPKSRAESGGKPPSSHTKFTYFVPTITAVASSVAMSEYNLPSSTEASVGHPEVTGHKPMVFSNPTTLTPITSIRNTVAGSDFPFSRQFSPLSRKQLFIRHPYDTAALMNGSYTTTRPSATPMSKLKAVAAAGFQSSFYSYNTCFPNQHFNPGNGNVSLKDDCRSGARFSSTPHVTSSTSTCVTSTPKPKVVAACEPPSTQSSFISQKTFNHPNGMSAVPKQMLYVGIILERTETLNSWGLVFNKDARDHALMVRVIPRNKVNGPKVKWCQVTNLVPNPSIVYRTTKTPIMPLDKYEPSLVRHFPSRCEEKSLQNTGLLMPYINPGDAIVAINGMPVSGFPSMGNLVSYIRQNCQRKMILVAMRHEHVWKAALEQMCAHPVGREQQKERGDMGEKQATTVHITKAVKEAWKVVLSSRVGNHHAKRKMTTQPDAKKRPKIPTPVYTNSLFRDGSRKPVPYCDNNEFDAEDGKRIRGFLNDEIEQSFHRWLRKRKATWKESRPRKQICHTAEDAITEEREESSVQHTFWFANGHESFDQWLSASKSKWTRAYSWHKERRETLQSECEKEVHFPLDSTTTIESQAQLNQFENWLSARKQQWRLERRKRQRHRVEPPGVPTEDEKTCSATGASSFECDADDPNPCSRKSNNNQTMYFDEILEDEEERLTNKEEKMSCQPMDITWVFDSQYGAPDDIIVNIMTYLLPSDHGNLLCLSFGTNFIFKQRSDMWKTLCPKHWVLPRRPRKSWCVMYITKIRAEEEASRKRSDDLLLKANIIIDKGDKLEKLMKLVRKGEKDFEFSVNYTSGVVLERNSLTNIAVIAKRHKIIKWLIEKKGADIESCDRGNFTPLMNAAWNGDKHIIRYLLGKGCDRTKVGYNHLSQGLAPATFKGLRAEGWARKRGHNEVADLIRFGL